MNVSQQCDERKNIMSKQIANISMDMAGDRGPDEVSIFIIIIYIYS